MKNIAIIKHSTWAGLVKTNDFSHDLKEKQEQEK